MQALSPNAQTPKQPNAQVDRISAQLIESHARKAAVRQAETAHDRDIFARGMAMGVLATATVLLAIKVVAL